MLPLPTINYIPRIFKDRATTETTSFTDEMDSHIEEWFLNVKNLDQLLDVDRCPSQFLIYLGNMLNAGVQTVDTERTKRQKIYSAIQTHKRRGSWVAHAKLIIDAITGYTAVRYVITDSDDWILCGDGDLEVGTNWAILGGDGTEPYGMALIGDGTEVEIWGNIYIDLHYGIYTPVLQPLLMYLPLVSDALDVSGNGNNGTATDITWTGGVANFNGTTSKVSVPDILGTEEVITISMRLKISKTDQINLSPRLFDFGQRLYAFFESGKLRVASYLNSSNDLWTYIPEDDIYDNTWKILVIETNYITNNRKVWIDNVLMNNDSGAGDISSTVSSVGNIMTNGSYFTKGSLSNFYIFNRALTDAERTRGYVDGIYPDNSAITQIVDDIAMDIVPAYVRVYLGYVPASGGFTVYSGGVIT